MIILKSDFNVAAVKQKFKDFKEELKIKSELEKKDISEEYIFELIPSSINSPAQYYVIDDVNEPKKVESINDVAVVNIKYEKLDYKKLFEDLSVQYNELKEKLEKIKNIS